MLRWLVVGIGDIATKRVLPAILAEPRSRLAGIVTRSPAKAERYQVPAWTDLDAALSQSAADAVYIATPVFLKGIHLSMASRIVKLLKVTGIKTGTALLTGGLALDAGLLAAIQEEMVNEKVSVPIESHPDAIFAGAIGAALWGAFRHDKLSRMATAA